MASQRRLNDVSDEQSKIYQRLSSGLRINTASDDAAGLAISSKLDADVRIFNKGIQNLNDGISYLNIAESMLSSLSDIVIRQKELAVQSSNGSLSTRQRQALNQEASALTQEFNRINATTKFNGRNIYDASITNQLNLQVGFDSISFSYGEAIKDKRGDGTFTSNISFAAPALKDSMSYDLDGDGNLDLILSREASNGLFVRYGNGDGSFSGVATITTGSSPRHFTIGDFDGDGRNDIATVSSAGVRILSQTSNRNFNLGSAFGIVNDGNIQTGDVNGDGKMDLIQADGLGFVSYINNGNGTFGNPITTSVGADVFQFSIVDINQDGKDDLVSKSGVFLSTGNGSFTQSFSLNIIGLGSAAVGDINGDGILDYTIGSDSNSQIRVYLGNGDGTFNAPSSFTAFTSSPYNLNLVDVDGDGILDISYTNISGFNSTSIAVRIGNGDGTFRNEITTAITASAQSNSSGVSFGDFNKDGVQELVTITVGGTSTLNYQQLSASYNADSINLGNVTQARAAIGYLDNLLDKITSERSAIGAAQSRAQIATSVTQNSSTQFAAASSRIKDVDVAEESSKLIQNQILQQVATSVLAQAKLQPELLLGLLR
jgi:flagellin